MSDIETVKPDRVVKILQRRSPLKSIPVVNLVCIIVGAAVGLTLITLAVIFLVRLILKKRHQRALADVEKKASMQQGRHSRNNSSTVSSPHLVANKIPQSHRTLRGWGTLSSDDNLYRSKSAQSKNEILSPNIKTGDKRYRKKRRSKRDSLSKHFRKTHLSAVIESPRSQGLSTPSSFTKTALEDPRKSLPTFNRKEEEEQQRKSNPSSLGLRQWPLSGTYDANGAEQDLFGSAVMARSKSAPSTSDLMPKDAVFGFTAARPLSHHRSISLGSQRPGSAPISPLPPLPTSPAYTMSEQMEAALKRISKDSLSSGGSSNSSILNQSTSPNTTMADFNTHPIGTNLVLQKRESGNELKPDLMGGRLQYHTGRVMSSGTQAEHTNSYFGYANISFVNDTVGKVITTNPAAKKDAQTYDGTGNSHSGDSAVELTDQFASGSNRLRDYVGHQRHSHQSQVSETGSPPERRRSSRSQASQSTMARSNSQYQLERDSYSRSSQLHQHARSTSSGTKPSALKGSASAKRAHKRQNCVRIEVNPTVLGPRNSLDMVSSPEDITRDDIHKAELEQHGRFSCDAPKLPASSTFDHDFWGDLGDSRSILIPSSITISPIQSQPAQGTRLSEPKHRPPPLNLVGASMGDESSSFSIPDFPSPGPACTNSVIWTGSQVESDYGDDSPSKMSPYSTSYKPAALNVLKRASAGTTTATGQESMYASLDHLPDFIHVPPAGGEEQSNDVDPNDSTPRASFSRLRTPEIAPDVIVVSTSPQPSRVARSQSATFESPNFSHPFSEQKHRATLGVMGSVKALRRMNSEIMEEKDESYEGRRYLGLGQGASPNPNKGNLPSPLPSLSEFETKYQVALGKENGGEDVDTETFWSPELLFGKRQSALYDEEGFLKH